MANTDRVSRANECQPGSRRQGACVRWAAAASLLAVAACSAAPRDPQPPDLTSVGDGGSGQYPPNTRDAVAPPPRDEVKLPPAYVVVHASPSLGDVRLCFRDAVASADVLTDPWPTTGNVPRTNYPGLAAGRGTVLRDTTVLSGVTDLIVDVYDAYAVGVNDRPKAVSCETLRNRSVQKKGTLGPVQGIAGPALLALTDCPQSGCPNGAPAELHLVPLATGTSAGAVKIQPVLLTRAIEPASVSWAGAQLATDLAFGAPSPGMEISLPTTGFESTQVALDGGQSWSLVDVQAWSDPAAVPSQFYAVKGLLVIAIVGKPGGVDVDALHPVAVAIDVGKGG